MPMKYLVRSRSIRIVAHISLSHLILVQSHTYMSCPLADFLIASYPNPSGGFNTSSLPKALREGFVFGNQETNLKNLQLAFKRYNSESFLEFVREFTIFDDPKYDQKCGTTVLGKPQALPDFFKFSAFPHYGVCQIQCDSKIVFKSENCPLSMGADLKVPVTPEIRAACEHTTAVFSMIASHGDPWQSYINCVRIGGENDPIPEKAKQECKATGADSAPTPTPGVAPSTTPGDGKGTSTPADGKGTSTSGDGKGTSTPASVHPPTGTKKADYDSGSKGGKENKDAYGPPEEKSKSDPETSPYGTKEQGHAPKCTIRKIRR